MQELLAQINIGNDVAYILLLMALFVVPRVLQRWRIPSAVTAFLLGTGAGLGLGLFQGDPTVGLLSTLGIVALFLFAGLEVDFGELRRGASVLIQHVVIRLAMVAAVDRDLKRLESIQNGDGGFPFWRRGDRSWPYVSIHVAHALERAQALVEPRAALSPAPRTIRLVEAGLETDRHPAAR